MRKQFYFFTCWIFFWFSSTVTAQPIRIEPNNTAELMQLLLKDSSQTYFVKHLPSDFPLIEDINIKKKLFLSSLIPLVESENTRILEQRQLAAELLRNSRILPRQDHQLWLDSLYRKYNMQTQRDRQQLLRRVDEVPMALVLAQAAMESGWGNSRFVLHGNNLFGHWTFNKNQGIKPKHAAPNTNHYVKKFPDLRSSIRQYLHNINTNHAYRELRQWRAEMRDSHQDLDPFRLADALWRYSQMGNDYAEALQQIMRSRMFQETVKLNSIN
ncbi:MAG: glucosaminidase domain-containing protein [Gammaproteobacteria bacterium]|nr:glucosaminidase domain-containing protein [Gammaproteobacteria bacterium]MDH5727964.1 glucosaminidase domain-containing protein [Gammaproteobacteria bacterium]